MRRLISFIVALLFFSASFAQVDVTWGNRFYDILEDCQDAKIVMEDYQGYYMWYLLNEYKGNGEYELKYYMAKLDKEKNIQKIYRMDFGHPSFKIEYSWQSGELIGFVLSRISQDKEDNKKKKSSQKQSQNITTGKANLYYQFFHTQDMRLVGDRPEKFKTYNYFSIEGQKPYLFKFSENNSFLSFAFLTNDSSSRAISFEVYDNKMRLLWEKKHKLNIQNDGFLVRDIAVSNDGLRGLIGINSFSLAKKKLNTDGKIHLIWLNEYEERTYQEQLDKAWATDLKCAFFNEEDYLIAGYYSISDDYPLLAAGSFSFSYDNRRGYKKNSSIKEFKEYENDDDVYSTNKELPIPSDMVAEIDYIYPMVGGNCILIGEQRYASKIIPPKRRGEKPTGENADFYRDIIITNVDKTGYITGSTYIPKRQKTYQGSNQYNSYALTRDRYGIYLMFNDHQDNYKGNRFVAKRNYNSDKLRTQVNFVQIYGDGSWRWHEVYNSKINKMPFYKTIFLTKDKEVLFLSHYRDNNIIGSIGTR
ncbi:MAG: hypothetical protein LBM25_05130 [Bacteroidales bacterium]|jgi:hypothetical protein|nr:hypothetical protein [Bacteroidales bacterium]